MNIDKSKIIKSSKDRRKENIQKKNITVNLMAEFNYLGIVFRRTGSFKKPQKHFTKTKN